MEAGSLRVDEIDKGGSVSHVRVVNQGKRPVLFLFGEEIRGAKQNRVANATFLVPAETGAGRRGAKHESRRKGCVSVGGSGAC